MSARTVPDTFELTSIEYEPLSKTWRDADSSYNGKTQLQSTQTWRSYISKRFSGWRGGVVASIAIVATVLLLNFILAIIAATAWSIKDGIATAYTGDCKVVSRASAALHFVINLLGSLLLGASNYCMQRLVAPTRKEIDSAHSRKKWLDIGMPSIRNLTSISAMRVVLWALLGLSSVPLHFVYNSVTFETIGHYTSDFYLVDPTFFTMNSSHVGSYREEAEEDQSTLLNGKYLKQTLFENITSAECISRYSAQYVATGDGYGVPDPDFRQAHGLNASHSVLAFEYTAGETSVNRYGDEAIKYSYCLSQRLPAKCQLQFSPTLIYIVVACNAVKVLVMVVILWRLNQETIETIVTIGDGIKSFIERPDATTKDCCLLSRRTINGIWKDPEARNGQRLPLTQRESWFSAVSGKRWAFSLLLCIGTIAAAVYLFTRTRQFCGDGTDRDCGMNGFGEVSSHYLISVPALSRWNSIIPYVLVANSPQAIVSFVYLAYNGLFTCMLANREWARYAVKRAPLRVTVPSLNQRSTYFLQLPYTFSVPLLVLSTLLHWFISQSIFLARTTEYDANDPTGRIYWSKTGYRDQTTTLGYSPRGLIACITMGSVLVVGCLLVANICKYPHGMPVGGTNSAVISAACHVRNAGLGQGKISEKENVVDQPLKWGVTIEGSRDSVGHCSFSSGEVGTPTVGHLYAGSGAKPDRKID